MGKKPTESRLDAANEQDGRLDSVEEEVQSIKAEMQQMLDSVQENLQRIPILEKGLEAVMVKLDQLLLQQGKGSSNAGISLSREKHVMEEPNSERCGLE